MDKQLVQLQLDVIHFLLKDAEVSYTKSDYFSQALTGLADILDTALVIYTDVFKDKNNKTYQLSHHFYAKHQKADSQKYSQVTFFEKKMPALIKQVHENNGEICVLKSSLMSSFFRGNPTLDINKSDDYNVIVVPFFDDTELVGLLSYRADTILSIKTKYPSLFSTINTIFRNNSRSKSALIENATYQTVLDLMPQRVFWKNRDSVYLGCNKAFSDDASLANPEKIIGVTDFDIFPEQAELYRSDDNNTMTTLEHLVSSEEPQTHQDGNTIWLRTSKRPIIDAENLVIGVVGTYDDITQLKGVQHELLKAKSTLENRVLERTKELSQSNEKLESVITELKLTQNQLVENEKMASLGDLVAGIAHEINTPLGIAVTSASTLEHVAKSLNVSVESGNITRAKFLVRCQELVDNSDLILRNLERASELVRSFKMIAVDQSNDQKRSLNLYSYLSDVIKAMTPKTSKKNIRILLAGDKDFKINTYAGALSQLTTNLIDNAFIHAFSDIYNGEIKISYQQTDNHLEITFQDNGIGMEANILKNIFEPFYTTNRKDGGTGLGLSVVYNLVTQTFLGSISCHSKPNELTKFTIRIPLNI